MKLKSIFYSLLIASVTSTAYAQVKVGANPGTITSTSNLEVESSNGTKVVVDKTTGNFGAGVTDPSQSIDGVGTARFRNIPTNATNNLILTVDANGVVAKQNASAAQLPTVVGSLSSNGVDIPWNTGLFLDTGCRITLPANSKYVVNATMLLAPNPPFVYTNYIATGSALWVRTIFSDSPASGTVSQVRSPDIIGSPYISGNLPANSIYSLVTGSIILQNTSNAPKTYYYLAGSTQQGFPNAPNVTMRNFGGSVWSENQIYAVPIN